MGWECILAGNPMSTATALIGRFRVVSTRRLIIAALLCGIAILAAFALQLSMISK